MINVTLIKVNMTGYDAYMAVSDSQEELKKVESILKDAGFLLDPMSEAEIWIRKC